MLRLKGEAASQRRLWQKRGERERERERERRKERKKEEKKRKENTPPQKKLHVVVFELFNSTVLLANAIRDATRYVEMA